MRKFLIWGVVGAVTVGGVVLFFIKASTSSTFDIVNTCLSSESYHIHPHLTILVDGQMVTIPKGIGLPTPTCTRPLHTHETDGIIHIEFEYQRDFTLGEFFKVWGQPLSRDQVLTYQKDASHDLILTVNGSPSDKWENLILADKQQIVISYVRKTP